MAQQPSVGPFVDYLKTLQDSIVAAPRRPMGVRSSWRNTTDGGGLSRPRVLADGPVIEKAAVQFTHSVGKALPPAATERHPHLAGRGFQAGAVSLIVHPRNPYAPTTHMNIRMFVVDGAVDEPGAWYFGGGFDLTPYYGFDEDALHWHRTCAAALEGHGEGLYPRLKAWCDDYFVLTHRQEQRGLGGSSSTTGLRVALRPRRR